MTSYLNFFSSNLPPDMCVVVNVISTVIKLYIFRAAKHQNEKCVLAFHRLCAFFIKR